MERRVSAFQKWEAGRDRCRPRKTGGSGTGAWRRGKSHARRHDTGLLRARNQNRKGKNGTGCRAWGSRQPCRNAVKRMSTVCMASAAGRRRATWSTGRRPRSVAAGAAHGLRAGGRLASFRLGRFRGRRLATGDFARCLVEQRLDFAAAQRLQRRRRGARHRLLVEARVQTQQHIPTAEFRATQPEGFARDSTSPDCAWPRAAHTSCRSRGRGELRCRWAGRTPRSARCGATGANEKRMKIHPFSAALRLWGRRRALATEPSPDAAPLPFPHSSRAVGHSAHATDRSPALDGEALAALRATCVDDLAATGGLHANAEAMGALATGNGRLVSTFHVALT